ncbi:MAG: alkaline phosphatase family protein, partial [Bdellovibrionales bacterium]|nr:alkaline phosphatase family protein [Bdellovibrionales bacterium]
MGSSNIWKKLVGNEEASDQVKLYWFIPDGVRAEPDIFTIFEWAKKGELPHLKTMMENGAYGYSIPVFPSHTPVNFATLLSGAMPKSHGVADGPMHTEGHPLDTVSVGGFRSVARKIPAVWSILEDQKKKVAVISTPGSTPPEIENGIVIRGRWGGWGADLHAVNYESQGDGSRQFEQGKRTKLFTLGPRLAKFVKPVPAREWKINIESKAPPLEFEISDWGERFYAYLYGKNPSGSEDYNRIIFSRDKQEILTDISSGEWGDWIDAQLKFGEVSFSSHVRFHIIKLKNKEDFKVRVLYDNLNRFITSPPEVAGELDSSLGPMVDFVDNFPPQLIHDIEDRKTFLDEMGFSFDWHMRVIGEIARLYHPDVVLHNVYNPNQMLTSRWWLQYVDPKGNAYHQALPREREERYSEVLSMYKKLDSMLGEIMKTADQKTLIVFSSDHGVHVLNKSVRVNNILAKNGLLKFSIDQLTGEPIVDWANSQAVFLQMDGIYLDPKGLGGKWYRAKGEAYDQLRTRVIDILSQVKDEEGKSPFGAITKWEDVDAVLGLPKDRVGDLVISNNPGYGWSEDMSH